MLPIVQNALLGLSLAAPIGPLNVESIKRGLVSGFWGTLTTRLGGSLGNLFCLTAIYLGMAHFITEPTTRVGIWFAGSLILILMGIRSFITSLKPGSFDAPAKDYNKNAFFIGFVLAIANPFGIAWWFGVFAAVLGEAGNENLTFASYLYSMTIMIGILLWSFFLAFVIAFFKKYLSEKRLRIISGLASLSLIWFGLVYSYNAYHALLNL